MDHKLDLPPFYIGQKVIYITGKQMPKNSRHTVSDIVKEKCGCWIIALNGNRIKHDFVRSKYFKCIVCGKIHENPIANSPSNFYSSSFRAAEDIKPPMLTFEQIKKQEKEEILILN